MRRLAASLLASCLALGAAPAMESPMVVGTGNLMVSIDPGLGLATILNLDSSGTRRLGWKHFLSDLSTIEKRMITQGPKSYSALRLGSPTVTPSVEEFIRIFPDKPSKKDLEAGRESVQKRVRDADDAFWEKLPAYDGKLSVAFNGQYLLLAIPSRHALLFYENANEKLELRGWYNYGPLLYVTTGWKSDPSPAKLAAAMALDEDAKKQLEGIQADKDGQPVAAAPSEVWVDSDANGNFVVVDTANRVLFTLNFPGKNITIQSVRNLSVDLLAPGYQTAPSDKDSVRDFAKSGAALIKALGIAQFDVPYVKALVAATATGESKVTDLQANVINGQLVLGFTSQHKILTYQLVGAGNGIELKSVRDSLFDSGLATIYRLAEERNQAIEAFKAAEKAAIKHNAEDTQRLLEMALTFDPTLVADVEKSGNLKSTLSKTGAWEPLLAKAVAAREEIKTKRAAIEAAAQAERDKKKDKKP